MSFSWSELFPSWQSWEFLGFITGIFSVLLLLFVRNPRLQWWNWIAGVISAAVYLYLFREWTLYGNAILQIPFLIISIAGAWKWRGQLQGLIVNVDKIKTTFASWSTVVFTSAIACMALGIMYPVLAYYDDASPLWDGLILTISLAAIYLQLKKYVQSWYLWIIVDLIAVPFHFSQDRGATAILYACYMAMCFVGWKTWHDEACVNRVEGCEEPVLVPERIPNV